MLLKRALSLTLLGGVAFTMIAQIIDVTIHPLIGWPLLLVQVASAALLLIDFFDTGFLERCQRQFSEDNDDPSTLTSSLSFLAAQVFPPVAGGSALGLLVSALIRLIVVQTLLLIGLSISGGVLIAWLMGQIGFGFRVGIITMLLVGMATAGIALAFLFFAFLGIAWSMTLYVIDWGNSHRSDDEV